MSRVPGCLLLVGIKQEEGGSNREIGLDRRNSRRQRLRPCVQQDSNGLSVSDWTSSGDQWQPSPASLLSLTDAKHETTIPPSVPTGDLHMATGSSVSTKTSDPRSHLETNYAGMHYCKEEGPTDEDPVNHLTADQNSQKREYTCESCGKTFGKHKQLNQHVNAVHKKLGRVKCDLCSKTLANRTKLKAHIDTVHKRIRAFNCETCGASFSWEKNLTRHIYGVHKNVRNFPCDICGYCFKYSGGLKSHVNTIHKGIRAFNCETCGASFSWGKNLTRHIDGVHKNRRNFPCDICGFSFKHERDLKTHIKCVHKKIRAFNCETCGASFSLKNNLTRHIDGVHKSAPLLN